MGLGPIVNGKQQPITPYKGSWAESMNKQELWDADPNCKHEVKPALGGGVKCTKCRGWFCY